MSKEDFIAIMTEVFDGLEEYYPRLANANMREYIAVIIWNNGMVEREDSQETYQHLRDRVGSLADMIERGNFKIDGRAGLFFRGVLDWWPED